LKFTHKTKRIVAGFFLLLGFSLAVTATDAASIVEVALVDKLDDSRGFCLDVVGSQRKATPARGLQAHTCYSYQGRIAVDQGFDGDGLKRGEFRLPRFQVCMTSTGAQPDSPLALRLCDGGMQQRFRFTAAGQIVPESDAALCITVNRDSSTPGAGGNPPHLIRRLSLQPCDGRFDKYQKWRIREKAD